MVIARASIMYESLILSALAKVGIANDAFLLEIIQQRVVVSFSSLLCLVFIFLTLYLSLEDSLSLSLSLYLSIYLFLTFKHFFHIALLCWSTYIAISVSI